jgi:hypothetical protein
MQPRPIIALILRALIFGVFQLLAYKAYGVPALVGAWTAVVIVTLIDVKSTVAKVSQTAAQTAWFIFLLTAIYSKHLGM